MKISSFSRFITVVIIVVGTSIPANAAAGWVDDVLQIAWAALKREAPNLPKPPVLLRTADTLPGLKAVARQVWRSRAERRLSPEEFVKAYFYLLTRKGMPDALTCSALSIQCTYRNLEIPKERYKRALVTVSDPQIAVLDALMGGRGTRYATLQLYHKEGGSHRRCRHAGGRCFDFMGDFISATFQNFLVNELKSFTGSVLEGEDFDEYVLNRLTSMRNAVYDADKREVQYTDAAEDRIVLKVKPFMDRLRFLAWSSSGTTYLFGPASRARDRARRKKARKMARGRGGPRTPVSKDIAWAQEIMKIAGKGSN